LHKWFEKIQDEFYQEREIEERMPLDNIKRRLYNNFHDSLFCTIPTLLHKFLLDKGVNHIVDYRPPLAMPLNIG
jgi:hypothetical protein